MITGKTESRTVTWRKQNTSAFSVHHYVCKHSLKSSNLSITLTSDVQPTKYWVSEQVMHLDCFHFCYFNYKFKLLLLT